MEQRTRSQLEKMINTVLWIVLIAFVGFAGKDYFDKTLAPTEFDQPTDHAPPLFKVEAKAPNFEAEDIAWYRDHFGNPVPPQGEAPEDWTEIEASSDPKDCGVCHPQQLTDWAESWHATGMGPGVMGQLVDWDGENDGMVKACQSCHAPNIEQYPRIGGEENPHYDEELRAAGLTCVGCHVREHERLGPPTADNPVQSDTDLGEDTDELVEDTEDETRQPHDGFTAKAEFQDGLFCEQCHDFRPGQLSLEDKLLQETWQEWRRTEYAEKGISCQDCHMPEGRHLWKGIHDADMTRAAFSAEPALLRSGLGFLEPLEASLKVTNVGAGHRFPTYTTPAVVLVFEQLDASGAVIENTRQEGFISRRVTPNLKEELWDTRLLPDEEFTMVYRAERSEDAVRLACRVEIWPDDAYRRFYEINLGKPDNYPTGRAQIEEALQASIDSQYIAWEGEVDLTAAE
ncbi:MAG: hypothetical protein GY913_30415 [Proteobacteria bacterium]|nr:hypothetical protein [Pseudomonadota bacterium]MCP4921231.1 hypothetical protein [Pseudomonadota bacterium]